MHLDAGSQVVPFTEIKSSNRKLAHNTQVKKKSLDYKRVITLLSIQHVLQQILTSVPNVPPSFQSSLQLSERCFRLNLQASSLFMLMHQAANHFMTILVYHH